MAADTIFAPATAPGRAGVAIIRISGPRAWTAASGLCRTLPPPRMAAVRRLRQGEDILDEALVIVFDEGNSFTGEKTAELHVHGSVAVVRAVLDHLAGLEGLRLAEPGEFTRRAMTNGRMDFTEVEGLADLLAAETEAQRKQAQRLLAGAVRTAAESWRQRLVSASALLEATIDFSEEDVPQDVSDRVSGILSAVSRELQDEARGVEAAKRLRHGYEVAILGPPNIGKSTLLNHLARREAVLTSAIAGTTRDVVEVRMEIAGLPVTFLDTAGLRDTTDPLEAIGIRRGRERARDADLRVFLVDAPDSVDHELRESDDLVFFGKCDINGAGAGGVSGLTGAGTEVLLGEVADRLRCRTATAGTLTHIRHRTAALRAAAAVEDAVEDLRGGIGAELVLEDLRVALRALESLVGRVDVEDILDHVFAEFCIGK